MSVRVEGVEWGGIVWFVCLPSRECKQSFLCCPLLRYQTLGQYLAWIPQLIFLVNTGRALRTLPASLVESSSDLGSSLLAPCPFHSQSDFFHCFVLRINPLQSHVCPVHSKEINCFQQFSVTYNFLTAKSGVFHRLHLGSYTY